MDNKTKILFSAFILAVLAIGFFCYQKYVIHRDYSVYAEADCDPSFEICFVYNCDPEAEECTGNPEEDTSYYKEVRRMANQFPGCDPSNEDCVIDRCGDDEAGCSVSLCDPEDAEQTCTSVDDFNMEESAEDSEDVETESEDVEDSDSPETAG